MVAYIIRRLLLIPITLTGIFLTSFIIINFAPGGPLEALIAEMQGISTDLGDRMIGSDGDVGEATSEGGDEVVGKTMNEVEGYTGREGLDPAAFERYREMFGLDRPWYVRMLDYFVSFLRFDFKESLRYGRPVVDIIAERIPVTMGLGLWARFSPISSVFRWASPRHGGTATGLTGSPRPALLASTASPTSSWPSL